MRHWYVFKYGQQYGPFSDAEMQQWARSGQLSPLDWVWGAGMTDWQPAGWMAGLGFEGGPPAAPASAMPVAMNTERMHTAAPSRPASPSAPRPGAGSGLGSVLFWAALLLGFVFIYLVGNAAINQHYLDRGIFQWGGASGIVLVLLLITAALAFLVGRLRARGPGAPSSRYQSGPQGMSRPTQQRAA